MSHEKLILICLACLLIGCGPDEVAILSTVEHNVQAAVRQTVEAIPPATSYPTLTPYPTYTPQATYTPNATYTPLPTATAQWTYTPYPSWTPIPPTATPTQTATPQPTATATAAPTLSATQAPASSPTGNAAQVQEAIERLLFAITEYRAAVLNNYYHITGPTEVDCPRLVNAYNLVSQSAGIDVSGAEPLVQGAYAQYQTQHSRFIEVTAGWANGCQEAINAGETKKLIGPADLSIFAVTFTEQEQILNPINDALRNYQNGD